MHTNTATTPATLQSPPSGAQLPVSETAKAVTPSRRIAAVDWTRGFVMMLMIVDHASMAFDRGHLDEDSALYAGAATMALPGAEFFTRWMTHICAPTFVFLAGLALALSTERRVAKGANAWDIDKNILIRGAIIALLDLTVVSFGSGRLNFGVLFAIGVSMMCMTVLRRLPTWTLLAFGLGWYALGEIPTDALWDPPGNAPPLAALAMANYATDTLLIKYPVLPWLAIMTLGWVFGRHMNLYSAGKARISPQAVLWFAGAAALVVFLLVRANAGYGDMFLHRSDGSWQQWLHVSKYPPSLTYATLELGLMCLLLASLMALERVIGVRENGPFLVFGQTAMFFYLVHRLVMEIPATYFGLRGVGDLTTTYVVAVVLFAALYPACRWYRSFKAAHPKSVFRYL
jgi:uncharacterized membrane protein